MQRWAIRKRERKAIRASLGVGHHSLNETLMPSVPFKNENLFVEIEQDGEKRVIASVPDLICILDSGNGRNLGTAEYKYGQRVLVLGVTAAPQWTDTERGLQMGDLRSFGWVREMQILILLMKVLGTMTFHTYRWGSMWSPTA